MPRSADQPEQREDKLDDSGFEALATCPAQAERSSQCLYRALADHQLHEYQQQQQLFLFLLLLFLYSAYGRVYSALHTERHPPNLDELLMQLYHQVLYVLLQPFDRQRFLCRSCVELVPERPYDFHELDFRTLDEALNLPTHHQLRYKQFL